ncbi:MULTISPECIES: hypothetical protein [unclassified Salinibacterium]|uniref:hypothetical protein n=1 Tax=unclassified Salinibacterium TaxID=2632331 RepID=UPI00141F6792|nr:MULTISPECIES: hypothetical protein [unclassified Salinibacterium]
MRELSRVPDTVRELQSRIRQMQSTKLEVRTLPTLPALADLLPGGGLRVGASYSVQGSASLAMALMAGPAASGAWCGVVGMPEFGAEAAAGLGIDLNRVVLVPRPGEQWLAVTGAIADALTVIVVKPSGRVTETAASRLSARLRQREAVLIALGPWPQAEARLSVSEGRWGGIGDGHGYLAGRQVTVTVSGAGNGRQLSRRIWMPDSALQVREDGTVRSGVGSSLASRAS